MKKPIIVWLLIAFFLKSIIYMIITPIWHGPDEQAHFAQVQYIAEFGHPVPNLNTFKDLSEEIYISEEILGTLRNQQGMNKFTLHPEYRLDYTSSTLGKYEHLVNSQPLSTRKTFVKYEATRYPPLFYYLSAPFYRLGYSLGLIDRVMLTRIASIIMGLTVVYFTYKTAALVVNQQQALTVAVIVAFQPMFGYLTATVNSDNLMNAVFIIFLFFCVKFITTQKITSHDSIALLITIIAGLFTKPHFVIVFAIIATLPIFLIPLIKQAAKSYPKIFFAVFTTVFVLIIARINQPILGLLQGKPLAFSEVRTSSITNPNNPITLPQHFFWTIRHTMAEVVPWYWGVFNWLGVTLPRVVNRIINRILILAALGLGAWCIKHRNIPKWQSPEKAVAFLALSSAVYFVVLMLWDWLFVRGQGFSFGMQGRYYFPTLVAHITLLVIGLCSLIPQKFQNVGLKGISMAAIALHLVGLYTLASAYYQLLPLSTLVNQISQYKPTIFKFPWLIIWSTLYVSTLGWFIIRHLKYEPDSRSRH